MHEQRKMNENHKKSVFHLQYCLAPGHFRLNIYIPYTQHSRSYKLRLSGGSEMKGDCNHGRKTEKMRWLGKKTVRSTFYKLSATAQVKPRKYFRWLPLVNERCCWFVWRKMITSTGNLFVPSSFSTVILYAMTFIQTKPKHTREKKTHSSVSTL